MGLITDSDFYSTYKSDHQEDYDPQTFQCAEETVAELLKQKTTSEHPGMLLGKVQSGKTRTFISALSLAFDNGFNVGVILTKNSKALVEQTKKRLEDEFRDFVDDKELEIYDIMASPTTFSKFELDSKIIFVVKKQADNLRRLSELFSESCPALAELQTLIIDDEADNASVGYSKKEGVIEANKIATQISELRQVINDVSFLQVTATPYSLYLQPQEVDVANTATFSPTRPKFTKLVPVPAAYVGGDTYFGESARSDEPTVESLIHVSLADKELAVMKKPDRRAFKLEEVLTSPVIEGLRRAVVTFIVGGTIQRIKGAAAGKKTKKLRYSFLIHTEAAKGAHAWQESIVETLAEKLIEASKNDSAELKELIEDAYDDLSKSIALNGESIPPLDQVLEDVHKSFQNEYLTVIKVNSDEQVIAMLDSSGQLKLRSPFNIFIGGQVLDRGVTLDSLIGFYYGRRPNKFQQDTVLQHSRMYGYRRDDLAVTRFYTTHYIRAAMFEMEEFDSSLRRAIENGHDQGVQFIRRADDGGIIPCSPNKILIATTHTLRPFRRMLPIGFQSGYKSYISKTITEIDEIVEQICGFNTKKPVLVDVDAAMKLLDKIQTTLEYDPKEDSEPFDWEATRSILIFLVRQHPDETQRGKVLIWAATGRDSSRFASQASHAKFIETPDSTKTEGIMAKTYAEDSPILFLLRQNGRSERGWRDTPFYWPVIHAQKNTPTAIYTGESIS